MTLVVDQLLYPNSLMASLLDIVAYMVCSDVYWPGVRQDIAWLGQKGPHTWRINIFAGLLLEDYCLKILQARGRGCDEL